MADPPAAATAPPAEPAPPTDEGHVGRRRGRRGRRDAGSRRSPRQERGARDTGNRRSPAEGEREDRSRRRRGGGSTVKSRIVLGVFLAVGLALLVLAIAWYPLQKTLCAREMRTAEGERIEQLVARFLELSQANENDIKRYITFDRDIPPTTQLRVIEAAAAREHGPAMFPEAVQIAKRCARTDPRACTLALEVAGGVFRPDRHETTPLPTHELEEWATQVERDELDRELGEAAIRFVGRIHESAVFDAMDLLLGIINKPGRDPAFVEWAIEALAGMVDGANLGRAISALDGGNAVMAATHTIVKGSWAGGTLIDAIADIITAAELPRALELINREEPALQAAGFELLAGEKILLGNNEEDMALRQRIASQVNLKLTPATLEQSAAIMLQLVETVRKHRLTDTASRLLGLLGPMDENPAPESKAAYLNAINALGVFFLDPATEGTKAAGEQVLVVLIEAVADEALRPHVLRAVGIMEPKAKGFEGTYRLLLALVAQGSEPSLEQAGHLAANIYGRQALRDNLGVNAAQWQAYMDQDAKSQLKYYDIARFYREHRGRVRRSDFDNDPHKVREAYQQAEAHLKTLKEWQATATVPLAVTERDIAELHDDLRKYYDGVRKFGLGAIDDEPLDAPPPRAGGGDEGGDEGGLQRPLRPSRPLERGL